MVILLKFYQNLDLKNILILLVINLLITVVLNNKIIYLIHKTLIIIIFIIELKNVLKKYNNLNKFKNENK